MASYPADLKASFVDEFVQFTSIIAADEDKTITHMSELLKIDGGLLLASFFNVGIALKMYLTIPINNCQGEVILNFVKSQESSESNNESTEAGCFSTHVH